MSKYVVLYNTQVEVEADTPEEARLKAQEEMSILPVTLDSLKAILKPENNEPQAQDENAPSAPPQFVTKEEMQIDEIPNEPDKPKTLNNSNIGAEVGKTDNNGLTTTTNTFQK